MKKTIETLTEQDFENAPLTQEPDGTYQIKTFDGITYFRNIENGSIWSNLIKN